MENYQLYQLLLVVKRTLWTIEEIERSRTLLGDLLADEQISKLLNNALSVINIITDKLLPTLD